MGRSVLKILTVCVAIGAAHPGLAASSSGIHWGNEGGVLVGRSPSGVMYVVRTEGDMVVLEGEKGDYRQTFGTYSDQFSAMVDLRAHFAAFEQQMAAGANLASPQVVGQLPDRGKASLGPGMAAAASDNATQGNGPIALAPEVKAADLSPTPKPLGPAPQPRDLPVKEVKAVPAVAVSATPLAAKPVNPPVDPATEIREWTVSGKTTLEEVLRDAAAKVGYRVTYEVNEIPLEGEGTINTDFFDFIDKLMSGVDVKPLPDVEIKKGNRWIVVEPGGAS